MVDKVSLLVTHIGACLKHRSVPILLLAGCAVRVAQLSVARYVFLNLIHPTVTSLTQIESAE